MMSKKDFGLYTLFALLLVTLLQLTQASRVSELTDRLIEMRKEGQWFVMFYAPWCAHCKRLEPIWGHVAQALHKTNIRVGRVDCTRFTAVADEFGVTGYPTIILIPLLPPHISSLAYCAPLVVSLSQTIKVCTCGEFQNLVDCLGGFCEDEYRDVGPNNWDLRHRQCQTLGAPVIKGHNEFTFRGDRNKEEMVNFALRLSVPPVQRITKPESLGHLKTINDLFFVFVGDCEGPHWEVFFEVAEKFQPHGFFYCTMKHLIKEHVAIKSEPSIFVYKENSIYFFEEDYASDNFNASLHNWVNEERFMTFPKVTRGNLHQFYQINKYLVLAVLEENKLQEISADMLEFRDMVESVIRSHRVRYHKHFQFGWVGSPDLANSIAMSILPLPHLIVVNSTTRHHHFPQDEPSQLTPQSLIMFLDQVHNQSAPVFGGNSWWVRLYSLYFEGRTSLKDMWRGNPVLTTVLFGLPLGFLTLICYSICCSDIMDADEEDEEELYHVKRE